jgi:hypothetical protein
LGAALKPPAPISKGISLPSAFKAVPRTTAAPGTKGISIPGAVKAIPRTTPSANTAAGSSAPAPAASGAAPAAGFQGDAQYINALADATAKANEQIAGLNRNIANAGTTYQQQAAATKLALQNNVTRAEDAENQRGGFALGALGHTIGQLNQAAQTATQQYYTKYQNDVSNWNAAIAGIQQGLSAETIALQLAAAAREQANVAKSDGTLGTDASAAPAPAGPAPLAVPAGAPSPAGRQTVALPRVPEGKGTPRQVVQLSDRNIGKGKR